MNQKCRVCEEPAAGFHFGAFTCEGCKSFFGRSYNNLPSITECKNNGQCVINKKNRTACKACRLRKCLKVGMSKSGSRYGRRSNWFKIHCLLQEQQQQMQEHCPSPPPHHPGHPHPLAPPFPPHLFSNLGRPRTEEELNLLGFDDYSKPPSSTPISPNSTCGGSSPRREEMKIPRSLDNHHPLAPTPPRDAFAPLRLANFLPHPAFLPPVGPMGGAFNPFAATHPLLFHGVGGLHPAIYSHRALLEAAARRTQDAHNNNNLEEHVGVIPHELRKPPPPAQREEPIDSRRSTPSIVREDDSASDCNVAPQENPMDLSVRSDGRSSSTRRRSDASSNCGGVVSAPEDEDCSVGVSASEEDEASFAPTIKPIKLHPLDLTTKV